MYTCECWSVSNALWNCVKCSNFNAQWKYALSCHVWISTAQGFQDYWERVVNTQSALERVRTEQYVNPLQTHFLTSFISCIYTMVQLLNLWPSSRRASKTWKQDWQMSHSRFLSRVIMLSSERFFQPKETRLFAFRWGRITSIITLYRKMRIWPCL